MKIKPDLFAENGENLDGLYLCVRNREEEKYMEMRENCENLWRDFRRFADNNFLKDFSRKFHQRWFEMYLTVFLLRSNVPVKRPGKGPDILIESESHRIWIEAVCATHGDPSARDAIPNIWNTGGVPVPFREMLLRITNSFYAKAKKFEKYRQDGLVSENDISLIAINVAEIDILPFFLDEAILRSLYGVGDKYISYNQTKDEDGESGRLQNRIISKSSGSEVNVMPLLDGSVPNISAVIGSSADALNMPESLGNDCILYRNLKAKNPWHSDYIPSIRQYRIEEADGGYYFAEP